MAEPKTKSKAANERKDIDIKYSDLLSLWRVQESLLQAYRVPIPLISPCDSEGIRHAVPEDVAILFRIMSPPLGSERSDAGF